TPADLALLGAIATASAAAMRRAREQAEARGEAERARATAALGAALAATEPPERLACVLEACRAAAAAAGGVWLGRGPDGAWAPRASTGRAVALDAATADWVAAAGQALEEPEGEGGMRW